jgi:hypothetical protein
MSIAKLKIKHETPSTKHFLYHFYRFYQIKLSLASGCWLPAACHWLFVKVDRIGLASCQEPVTSSQEPGAGK